ncbi:hypothetical protein ACFSOZ_29300 [Mesorhizobium newzealandense]|uniref:DUF3426 domain-containing protein n=1 Tax=Mesorhizobium newzealandense TaxID=1300302 RepID=A0ABW4UHV1_9HYPH
MPTIRTRRLRWLLLPAVVCLFFGGSVAWSQDTQPDQQSRPPQPSATENQQDAKEDAKAPLAAPAPSQGVGDEKASHDEEGGGKKDWSESFIEHAPDWSVAFFTFVLCVFTGLLWRSTNKLWLAGERQMKLIEANAKLQSADMQASIKASEAAAKAAQDTASVTREIGETQTRAYLTVTGGTAIYNGGMDPEVLIRIKNTGTSPAMDVRAMYQKSKGIVFTAKPTGGRGGVNVSEVPLAKMIGAGSEVEYSLGVFADKQNSKAQDGLGFALEGILEYQTVFDVKTGRIDMDTPFLFWFTPERAMIESAIVDRKELRYPMQLYPAFMSGWILDYRRIIGGAREKERREKQESKQT